MPWPAKIGEKCGQEEDPNKVRTKSNVDNWSFRPHEPALGKRECVRNVTNSDVLPDNQHADHIEPIVQRRRPVPIHPNASRPTQLPSLPMMHRLDRRPEALATTCLHLDEGHLVATLHHEVDIPMTRAKAMRDHRPSIAAQPSRGDALPKEPECLPLFRHGRHDSSAADHECHRTNARCVGTTRGRVGTAHTWGAYVLRR